MKLKRGLSNIGHGSAMADIGGGFLSVWHAQFQPIWRDFLP